MPVSLFKLCDFVVSYFHRFVTKNVRQLHVAVSSFHYNNVPDAPVGAKTSGKWVLALLALARFARDVPSLNVTFDISHI